MACDPRELTHVPLFALLEDEEAAVLADQVELKHFAPRQRIYKIGDPPQHAYVMMSGAVRVTTVDEDQQVLIDEPGHGDFFGFASMLEETPHQTNAAAMEDTSCLEVNRDDIATLLQGLANKLNFLTDQVGDVEDLLRDAVSRRADSKPSAP